MKVPPQRVARCLFQYVEAEVRRARRRRIERTPTKIENASRSFHSPASSPGRSYVKNFLRGVEARPPLINEAARMTRARGRVRARTHRPGSGHHQASGQDAIAVASSLPISEVEPAQQILIGDSLSSPLPLAGVMRCSHQRPDLSNRTIRLTISARRSSSSTPTTPSNN